MNLADMFINLSAEYPAILQFVLLAFGATGVIIASSAVFDITRAGKRDSGNGSVGAAVFWKMLGGASMIDLAFWSRSWTQTLWSSSDELGIASYGEAAGGDYFNTAVSAALGIIVITGYVTLGRAYLMATRLGHATPDQRSDMVGNIIARIVAGSAMIASMHLVGVIEQSFKFQLS